MKSPITSITALALALTASPAGAQNTDIATLNGSINASVQNSLGYTRTPSKNTQNIRVQAFVDKTIQDILGPNARRDGGRIVIDIETIDGKNGWEIYAGKYNTPNTGYMPSVGNSLGFSYSKKFK